MSNGHSYQWILTSILREEASTAVPQAALSWLLRHKRAMLSQDRDGQRAKINSSGKTNCQGVIKRRNFDCVQIKGVEKLKVLGLMMVCWG